MAENRELKPKSFRIDDLTAEKFKEISGRIGGNQQETMAKLIEAYEMQAGKAAFPDKKADIEEFERYAGMLSRMYMSAIESNQNLTQTIRNEYAAQLMSKDDIIQDLQTKLADAKQENSHAGELLNRVISEKNQLKTELEQTKAMLADKEKLNIALSETCATQKAKIDRLPDAEGELDKARRQIMELQEKLQAAEIESQKLLLESERRQHEEIDKYQQKYLELLDQIGRQPR